MDNVVTLRDRDEVVIFAKDIQRSRKLEDGVDNYLSTKLMAEKELGEHIVRYLKYTYPEDIYLEKTIPLESKPDLIWTRLQVTLCLITPGRYRELLECEAVLEGRAMESVMEPVEEDVKIRTWFLNEDNWERVKYCPVCGSDNITMPNDLVEWTCKKCGAWWSL